MDAVARHWIDGEAYGRPEADSLDPASGERVGYLAQGGAREAEAAVAAARRAFDRGICDPA